MKLRLEALDSPNKSVHEFEDEVVVFGRDAVCDLPLPGVSAVSGRHAQITLTAEGAFLSDVGSTNGTFVNDRRIDGRVKVRPGDLFRLGHTGPNFRIAEIDLTPRAAAPAPRFRPAPEPVKVAIVTEDEGNTAPLPVPARPRAETAEPRSRPDPRPAARETAGRPGQTRMMVVSLQQKNRNMMIGAGGAVLLLLLAGAATGIFFMVKTSRQEARQREQEEAQRKQDEELRQQAEEQKKQQQIIADNLAKQTLAPEEVYARTVKSAVYIEWQYVKGGKTWTASGSGALIDRERRLVITAYHVVRGANRVQVLFPKFAQGQPMRDWKDYSGKDFIDGDVWATSPELDLAVIQLARVPEHVVPLKLAEKSPEQNARVHAVGGNPNGSKGLWIASSGSVKEVVQKRYGFGNGQTVNAWVVRTQVITARGNSGGPLVNDRSELVGIVSGGEDLRAMLANELDIAQDDFIDVRHIRDVLANRPQQTLPPAK